MGLYSVFPMGTTIYNPDKAWSGYTLMQCQGIGAILIDMNGNVVKCWKSILGFPNKLLPGGYLMGSLGLRDPQYGYQDQTDLVQVDWDGKVVWKYDKKELVHDGGSGRWLARQHHDYQREGNPVGYYVPGMECKTENGNTLILCHEDIYNKKISEHRLLDDVFIEVDWEGNIIWEWHASKHFNELNFDEIAKNVLARNPNIHENGGGQGDWLHINSMSVLGPNRWYDMGDERFNPKNIIWDAREANIMAIISKKSGKIVWQIGPDFTRTKELRIIGQIIGQHHCHMIPKGLPGEGNILLFDNGGWAGYGMPSKTSRDGSKSDIRDHSRVLEIDPVTLEVVWEFKGNAFGGGSLGLVSNSKFYSPLISSAQRLPNGNTMVCEGCSMRIFEVTPEKEIVWEFITPFKGMREMVYRAYRYPYDYVPQLDIPQETPVQKLDCHDFRVPGASMSTIKEMTEVEGIVECSYKIDACVTDNQV